MRRREFLRAGALVAASVSWGALRAAPRTTAPQVVIAGGGFAGACCALQLRRLNPAIQVTLVDPNARYVTCPMSNEVLADLRAVTSLTVTRAGLRRTGVRYVPDSVAAVDPATRRVRLRGGGQLGYDRLVVAPGIRFLFGQPEGYDTAATQAMPHAWQAGAQTQLLARQLHAIADGGTIGISVPAGLMRCPPGPYERASLIAQWLKRRRPRCKVLIFDANNHFPRQDVFSAAWRELYPGMIEWIAPADGGAITRVDVATNTLYSASGAHRVAVANVIPPQAPGQLALDTGLASGHGWCPVTPPSFESQVIANIHVIGDACIAGAMPKSASAARSHAVHCAAAIGASFDARTESVSDFESVCYSLVSPRSALAIHGQFALADGEIRQTDPGASRASDQAPTAQNVRAAARWYEEMRLACFGD